MAYTVRLEPVGVEMEVEQDETVLQAAFRQGIMLMHGCKEGQCASCKSVLLDGDAEHEDFSTFALSESEQEEGKVLLCRLFAYSDLEIELLNYDEETLTKWIPARRFEAAISGISELTHDVRQLDLVLAEPLTFRAGQYVDIAIPGTGVSRAYSMASPPSATRALSFVIKVYPDGEFSSLLAGKLAVGDPLELTGPFGVSFRDEHHEGTTLLVGGGSGMAPLWSILRDLVESARQKPVRFYYGARALRDLFYLDEIAALGGQLKDFRFVPALSEPDPRDAWDGRTGLIHEVVASDHAGGQTSMEAYACGPPPMVDAVLPVLRRIGVDPDHIHLDKFTPAARPAGS